MEQVTQFKYLRTIIDHQLQFQNHVDYIFKKGRQCPALLRKLKSLNTSQCTMTKVYKSLAESVLTFNIVSWYTMTRAPLGQTEEQTGTNRVLGQRDH